MHCKRGAGAVVAAAGLCVAAGSARSQVDSWWAAPVSGSWNQLSNWTAGIPSGSEFAAHVDAPGTYALSLTYSVTIGSFYKTNSTARLEIPNYSSLGIAGGNFLNNGMTIVNPEGGDLSTYLRFDASTLLRTDAGRSGEIRLNARAENLQTAYLQTSNGAVITNTPTHVISGGGRIYATLVNNGVVRGDHSGAMLHMLGGDKTNNAVIEALNGGTVRLEGLDVEQGAAGVVRALGGGAVELMSLTLRGGVAEGAGGGVVRVVQGSHATLRSGAVTKGAWQVPSGSILNIVQPEWVHSPGTVTVNSGGGAAETYIRFEQSTLLRGAQIALNANAANLDSAYMNMAIGATLTVDAASSILGSGRLPGALVNFGTVGSGAGQTLELSLGSKVNEGTFRTTDGVLLVKMLDVVQGPSGRMLAAGGQVQLFNSVVRGGRLDATGDGRTVVVGTEGTLRDGVSGSGLFTVPSSATLTIDQPAWQHTGEVKINSTGSSATTTLKFNQSTTLTGVNVVLNGGAGGGDTAAVRTVGAAQLSVGADGVIGGHGRVYANLVNAGRITCGPGQLLELLQGTTVNNYRIEAEGGTVVVNDIDVIQGLGGSVRAAGGVVRLIDCTITGGRLDAEGGGRIEVMGTGLGLRNLAGSSGSLFVPPGVLVTVDQPLWTHEGTLTINEEGVVEATTLRFDRSCRVAGADIVLNGVGASGDSAAVTTLGSAVLTVDPTSTLSGGGRLYANLINSGEIESAPGRDLELLAGTKTNNGLIRAAGGEVLLRGVYVQQNGAGRLHADDGDLRFANAEVRTGSIDSSGGGTVVVDPGTSLTLHDGVVSSGVLRVAEGAALYIDQPEWSHAGIVVVEGSATGGIARACVDQTCTVNDAEIRLDAVANEPASAVVSVRNAAVLTMGGGAMISGTGQILAHTLCSGTLSPGAGLWGLGELVVYDRVTMSAEAVAEFDIAGQGAAQHDRVTGSVLETAGTLRVRLAGGYEPDGGEEFDIVAVATRLGAFDAADLPRFAEGAARFVVSYPAGGVRLRARACAPDFDADGFVNGSDFDAFVQAYEAGEAGSDFDGDSFITGVDFDAFVQSFESGC